MKYNNIGCMVINFLRPDATIKCIDSLLIQIPDIQIYLGDQDIHSKLKDYYQIPNIHYYSLPYDCGISVARNQLITQALKDGCDYFMWIDNDFVFDNNFNLSHAITILEQNKKIGVVGGSLKKNGVLCNYERFMYYDRPRGILTYVPIKYTHPKPKYINDIEYYDCDITFNFCVAKKELWENPQLRWNEKIKVKYEHSTFFLLLQQYSNYKVAYCPSFSAHHEHVGTQQYQNFRMRSGDEEEFSNFFKLKCMFAIGEAGRDFIQKTPAINTPKIMENLQSENIQEPKNDIELLNNHGLIPILLNYSCLNIIKKKQIISPYYLGFKSEEELYDAKQITNQKHIYELYTLPTKPTQLNGAKILVPCSVITYLEKTFGKNWKRICK